MTPEPKHTCCPNASMLRVRSVLGRQGWRIIVGVPALSIAVTHCPWCGVELATAKGSR